MSFRTHSALGRWALAFALLLALSTPLAAATHEPHAHSPSAPEAAQAPAHAELAPGAPAAAGCCAMADAAESATPKAAGCAAGDHACCAKCEHGSQPGAASCCAGHMGDHAAAHAGHHPGMTAPVLEGDAKPAESCGHGGDAATCCAGCDHCQKAEGGGCCAGHAAMAKKAAFACPMHPAVTGAEGGKCAECGMKLEAVAPSGETKKP
jgi:hypothetical protein